MRVVAVPIAVSVFALTGCSTTPLPENFSGKNTYEIVQKIRCEARDAIRAKAIALMLAAPSESKTHATGLALQNGSLKFEKLKYSDLDKEAAENIKEYEGTAIAYDFTFDISEQSVNSLAFNFKGPVGLDVLSLGLTSGGNFTRGNMRNFAAADSFGDLATKMDDAYCKGLTKGVNVAYPITGDIGLAERVDTFIDLNQSGGLTTLKGNTVKGMADTLKFTTVVSLTAAPKVEIKAPGSRLTDASFSSANTRTDQHQVVIALKIPEKPVTTAPVSTKKPTVAKSSADRAKVQALELIDQQYNRAGNALLRDIKTKLETQ